LDYLRVTANAIGMLAVQAGATSLPIGIHGLGVDRESLEVTVVKRGPGIQMYFERKEEKLEPKIEYPLRFRAMFWDGFSVVFGTNSPATDGEISARLNSCTASWLGDHFGESWPVKLTAEPKTSDLGDEIYAKVVSENDESWQGIRRIPGLPSVAAPLVNSIAATKEEEAGELISYGWGAGWPVKGTIALSMNVGTPQTWEFSVTYTLERTEGVPTWTALWGRMGEQLRDDSLTAPACMSQNEGDYLVSCEKVNQTIRIVWRQQLADGLLPPIPEDHGLPVCTVYGAKATLKMRGFQKANLGAVEIVKAMYGDGMEVQIIASRNWSYDAAMMMEGEVPVLAEEVAVQEWKRNPTVLGFNEQLRGCSEIVANVDKGFRHYIKYFRSELPVTAAIRVEKGHHGDYGWGVYFEQGRHRCVLAGTLVDRPEEEIWEDAMWTACAAWATFEPILGQPKIHQETLWTPDEFGHIFA
jgi:hypothetical protein